MQHSANSKEDVKCGAEPRRERPLWCKEGRMSVALSLVWMQERVRCDKGWTQLVPNTYDITVTSDPASIEDKICLTVYENKKVVPLTVKNSGVTTVYLNFSASDLVKNIFTVRDSHGIVIKAIEQHTLRPGEAYEIKVHFYSHHAGFYEQLLVFKFETCQQPPDKFEIMRLLEIIQQTSLNDEPLPTAASSSCNLQLVNRTPAHGELQAPLNWRNYSSRFHLLLHLEELQHETDIEKYNKDDVPMFMHSGYTDLFTLRISDIAEDLTVKLSGNLVLVTPLDQSGGANKIIHKGWVHYVDAEQVYLQFDQKCVSHFKESMRVSVNFVLDRIPLRNQHRAAELVYTHRLREVLFPTGDRSSHHSHLPRLLELKGNPEQRVAVQHIVAASAKPAPYVVFGPPGTGKTMTLVKAIEQIVMTQTSYKILACANSNSATDHLCQKILERITDRHEVYRLYALSCPVTSIPHNEKLFCNLNRARNILVIPSKEELMRHNIMVTTLLNVGRLVTGGIPPGHYTYIFVDEAGQATETQCIIPFAGLLNPQKCQVVLAGDINQLGPVIMSKLAEKHGLGVSLLERLMRDINLYKLHETYGFNNRFVTKLLRNYRSHPALLKIPNELFYKGELQAFAPEEKCSSFCDWECLPKKGFPLIFHGVAGTDQRDFNNPSLYNMAEVEVLKEYLKALVDHFHKKGVTKIEPKEIGIIAPYRKQVAKIQKALQTDKDLRKEDLENVLVGSVEQFQGQEFSVILMSTVRSTFKLTKRKQHFTLGFVNNEKRFNVALTRVQALLIVVGDPRVLKTDPIWNKFIQYCYREGGYRGITVSDAEDEDDTRTTVQSLNLW
ncbi:putative helicase mov-10-B.1 [Chelmon rostratus]|uniref:putative helicase mov-10-B.1 n=1 Tax=Chelmon rostratus TaxID=109905 RepID=UPI001BE89A97|nr:putative helicase mov-10-B.1 [Chelmon rostratus]